MCNLITAEVLVAFAQCPRKAFLLLCAQGQGAIHPYVQFLQQQKEQVERRLLTALSQQPGGLCSYTPSALRSSCPQLIQATLNAEGVEATCTLLTKVAQPSSLGAFRYEPTICVGTHSITHEHRLELLFVGYVLDKLQGAVPERGRVIGADGRAHSVLLGERTTTVLPLLVPLQRWRKGSSPHPPPLALNKHCPTCQFQQQCRAQAVQSDHLSLLAGATPKVIQTYAKKGIFTINQLSYLYQPRRVSKRAMHPHATHKLELQALALRTGKIYLHQLPALTRQDIELFVDFEGIPDQHRYYLIGVLVSAGGTATYHPLWAETLAEEAQIWQAFLDKVRQYPAAPLYHYGSYESQAFRTLSQRYGTGKEHLPNPCINVLASIYGRVYFPVRSNGLKEIGQFLGMRWSSPHASGLQSLVWRHAWDATHQRHYHEQLVTYNREDCLALKGLTDALFSIQASAQTLAEVDFSDQPKRLATPAGEVIHRQFEVMLRFAHFGYDQQKIRFRPLEAEPEPQQRQRPGVKKGFQGQRKVRPKASKVIQVPAGTVCPKHPEEPLRPVERVSKRLIIDLVLTKHGMKKTISEYVGTQGYCSLCARAYAPPEIRRMGVNQLYGHGFLAWVVYQRVALRMTHGAIAELLAEQFQEPEPRNYLGTMLKQMGQYYRETEQHIIERLLASPFLHADETSITVNNQTQYVWTFTTDQYVIFKLSKTREAALAQEFLASYQGVLISDFYAGYDALPCRQQKCWVHLIRELNEDLWLAPFDSELAIMVAAIRDLIIPIMEAVQRYGLKKRHLQKFTQSVAAFYARTITDREYSSELAQKYQKRFIRYRASLFLFLQEDGIPWQNNTAERALRHVAKQQQISLNFFESVMPEYLRLLSIRQTYRFQKKSFFQFLFSQQTNIDQFK